MNRILIAGATGIAGSAACSHFSALSEWDVLALSRRKPASHPGVQHIAADLMDADACQRAFEPVEGVTHLLYMALREEADLIQGWREQKQIGANLQMLKNVMAGLERSSPTLRHISILQGGKAYGSHLAAVPVPAKERWPRGNHEIFYWPQEDYLREKQEGSDWNFTVLRPQMILGNTVGSPMNIVAAIGVLASVMRELGRPLSYPGGGKYITACTDSRMIASAAEWAGTNPAAAGEAYNIVNGDVLVFQDIWESLAHQLSMPTGDPEPICLAEEMPKLSDVWDRIVKRHNLRPLSMEQVVGGSWQFADHAFTYGKESPPNRIVMSPIKVRQAGFADCYDTEDSLLYWLGRMQEDRVLPVF